MILYRRRKKRAGERRRAKTKRERRRGRGRRGSDRIARKGSRRVKVRAMMGPCCTRRRRRRSIAPLK
jgi:hypothetical protein